MDEDLSLEFIKQRFKTDEELDYVCNLVFAKYLSLQDKIDYVSSIDIVYSEQIATIFNLTSKKAQKVIDDLLIKGIINQFENNKYWIYSHEKLKSYLQKMFNKKKK